MKKLKKTQTSQSCSLSHTPTLKRLVEPGEQTEARWLKMTVVVPKIEDLCMGLPLGVDLLSRCVATGLYFARYTSNPLRLEFQLLTKKSTLSLRRHVLGYAYRGHQAKRVTFEPCNGSWAHALGFQAVTCLLTDRKLANGQYLADLSHWMFNMAGFTYAQEAASAAAQAFSAIKGLPGMSDHPYFGLEMPEPKVPAGLAKVAGSRRTVTRSHK